MDSLFLKFGAEDEIRTRDVHLGKVTLYHWATPAYIHFLMLKYYNMKSVICQYLLQFFIIFYLRKIILY